LLPSTNVTNFSRSARQLSSSGEPTLTNFSGVCHILTERG
jgi:hypothetical protein